METYIIIILILVVCMSISSIIGGYIFYNSQKKISKDSTINITDSSKTPLTSTSDSTSTSVSPAVITPAPPAPVISVPAPVPVIPKTFTSGSQTATQLNDDGGGNAVFFDRHDINCNGQVLNELHLNRADAKSIQFQYTCSTGGVLGTPLSKNTDWNDEGGGNTVFLDRHNVDCGVNSVISELKLVRNGYQYQYQYQCIPSTQTLNCRQTSTPWNDEGGGNSIFLDRHDLKCNSDEAISEFKLVRDGNGKYQYQYTCCKN